MEHRLYQKVKLINGRGCIHQLPDVLAEGGYSHPFLVYDRGLAATPVIPKIHKILEDAGIGFYAFDQVRPDPTADIVEMGTNLFKENACDCVIAIGGGSSIDSAKAINIMTHNEGKILDYVGRDDQIKPVSSLICVPTTAGTGSEVSNWIVISDLETGAKHPIDVINAMAEYSFLDPELTVGMPPQITAATGLDAFCHAFEGYTSKLANPLNDPVCEKTMELIVKYLPRAVANGQDIEARENMQIAATYGGFTLIDCLVQVGHVIAHEMGTAFHVPHGAGCAYACPEMIRHCAYACPDKIRKTGEILGVNYNGTEDPREIAEKCARAFIRFRDDDCKLRPLSSYEPDLTKVDLNMAKKILADPITPLCPAPVTLEDIMWMLYKTYVG